MYIHPTIDEGIENQKNRSDITHRMLNSCSFITDIKTGESIKIPFNPLYSKFKDYFDEVTAVVELNEKEQELYRYQPKRFSLRMYNTTEYWSLLLYLNECASITDFDLTSVRFVYNDKIQSFLNELFTLSRK